MGAPQSSSCRGILFQLPVMFATASAAVAATGRGGANSACGAAVGADVTNKEPLSGCVHTPLNLNMRQLL